MWPPLTLGFTIFHADSFEEAVALAQKCPLLKKGMVLEVSAIVDMMNMLESQRVPPVNPGWPDCGLLFDDKFSRQIKMMACCRIIGPVDPEIVGGRKISQPKMHPVSILGNVCVKSLNPVANNLIRGIC
jgi:hypothetical protein